MYSALLHVLKNTKIKYGMDIYSNNPYLHRILDYKLHQQLDLISSLQQTET